MAKKGEAPLTDWKKYTCRVFKYYSSFAEAKKNVNEAKFNSDLSDAGKRTNARSYLPPSLPAPPSLQACAAEAANLEASTGTEGQEGTLREPQVIPSLASNENLQQMVVDANAQDAASSNVANLETFAVTEEQLLELFLPQNCPKCAGFEGKVLLMLNEIQQTQRNHTDILNKLEKKVSTTELDKEADFEFEDGLFPATTMDDLDKIEKLVSGDRKARNQLVLKFASCGGGDVDEAIKFMMKVLMTDDLSSNHCAKGPSTKRAFTSYPTIIQCLLVGLKRIGKTSTATNQDMEKAIGKNIKQSYDRVLQRNSRRAAAVGGKQQGKID